MSSGHPRGPSPRAGHHRTGTPIYLGAHSRPDSLALAHSSRGSGTEAREKAPLRAKPEPWVAVHNG
jgi:hypothetical protein